MWNIKEENLSDFKITSENRLSPGNTPGFMIGTAVWCSLIIFFFIFGLFKFGWDAYPTRFEKTIVLSELVLYGLQIILILFFSIPKMAFRFQRLQLIAIIYFAFQSATMGFMPVVIHKVFGYPTNLLTLIYVGLLIIGGVIVHILSTLVTFHQAEKGAFNVGENSSGFFNKKIIKIIIGSLIYVVLLLLLIFSTNFSSLSLGNMFFYTILSVILYTVAISSAEFQLLAYCKFKFPSFIISWDEHRKENKELPKRPVRKANKKKKKLS
ncbi:hypothetical protein LCY76_07035 [Fictibacillus sp. KIGAM418]|uniref:Uncharacterized protein n=1 Tax=Fictibacillus marinisediminis TaxID=2878389 RepID=A0A9X2BGA8_9BACL|nr:hypothetical protein [Fictibacillus marinisediminis]MCK6256348.1 hypothetical protein [Fictibacillus marinisediminis]